MPSLIYCHIGKAARQSPAAEFISVSCQKRNSAEPLAPTEFVSHRQNSVLALFSPFNIAPAYVGNNEEAADQGFFGTELLNDGAQKLGTKCRALLRLVHPDNRNHFQELQQLVPFGYGREQKRQNCFKYIHEFPHDTSPLRV